MLCLYVADFAILSRDLFITKSFALSQDSFAVRIDDCFPFPKLTWKDILLLWIILNTVSSLVFEFGRRKTNLSTLKSKLYLGCPTTALNVRLLTPNHIHEKTFLIISSIIWEFSHPDLGMYCVIHYLKISKSSCSLSVSVKWKLS